MKLSQLKPCASCRGPLLVKGIANWYVLRQTIALLRPNAAREVMGLTTMFGGALELAEAMAPAAEDAVAIMSDLPGAGKPSEIHICFNCYCDKFGNLPGLFENAGDDGDDPRSPEDKRSDAESPGDREDRISAEEGLA